MAFVRSLFLGALVIGAVARADTPQTPAEGRLPPQRLQKIDFSIGMCDLYLVAQQDVQRDLKLSAGQVLAMRILVVDATDKKRSLPFDKYVDELNRDQQLAMDLLSAEQVKRVRQISCQSKSTAAFWDDDVRRKLHVSDEQFARIKQVPYVDPHMARVPDELIPIQRQFGDYPKRKELKWQLREWRRLAVLSAAQRSAWQELLGTPFRGKIPSPVLVPVTGKPADN